MSLIGTIQQSAGALQAAQVGLQVVGNNIANANTSGYIRQQLEQASASAVRDGGLIKGLGVRTTGIVQKVDKALVERMYRAKSALDGADALQRAYSQLEEITTDLDNTGLSQQLSLFNNSLHELSAQPSDRALGEFVVLQGETLASNIRRTREAVLERRELWDGELVNITSKINHLAARIADLNTQIAGIEGGGLIQSDATGLRDQRYRDLEELSGILSINVQEQASGAVSVFIGGDYLINSGNSREVYTAYNDKLKGTEVRIVETDSPLQAKEGVLVGSMKARDSVFGAFVDTIDAMATGLIRSVNELHSQGQGRRGFSELVGSTRTESVVPLTRANLPWSPNNGTLDINVVDDTGELVSTHRINVQMLDRTSDSTVASIVAEIDTIPGLQAGVTSDGRVSIASDSPVTRFTFGEDTSGFLAAAGINSFFTGDSAGNIGVNEILLEDSDYLAISSGGVGADTDVLNQLVDLVDAPLDSLDGRSIRETYENRVASLGQQISLQQNTTIGLKDFYATLQSQHLAITGVNIDEESIRMIAYQRAFQASSRVIAAASEMLELLVAL
ncbi:MAG: flagellar hook-associated protein FlgK [Rhodopirellula sp.]|nr:flagellar hook-associated protein FlgK [Rhodopirellula sp.]OUX52032.1 MAG: flagellar hook-associated protein FlgK [Rhodopirellula sp. TMED283]